MARSLVDTNVLIYSRDLNEPAKRTRAIISATAREADVHVVLSEDFQNGREIESVRFVNPFTLS